jgi:diguanylate cyclase (GGDEF)-like protein/PAS domain S-box-containing protein
MLSRSTPEGRFLFVSAESERVVGWTAEELVGRNAHGLVHPEDLALVTEARTAVLAEEGLRNTKFRFLHKDGHYRWMESTATALRDERGDVVHVQARMRDATTRPEVEEQLRRSELLHRTLTANLPDTSTFLLDRDLRVMLAEGEGMRTLPWIDENMFRGRLVAELQGELPGEVLAASLKCYGDALNGERGEFEFASDGHCFEVVAVPIRGQDSEVESVLAVVRDVTRRRNTEHLLAQRVRQQECVARLGQVALRERVLRALLDEIVGSVAGTLDLGLCAVLALRRDEELLDRVAATGFREDTSEVGGIPNDPSTQAGYVLSTSEPMILDDLNTETRFGRVPALLDHGIVSGISVIVAGRERPFGLLSAYTTEHRTFSVEDVNFLTSVANVLSAAVERHDEEEITRHAALHDRLTGLPNRTLALDRLEHALGRRSREGTNVAALMFDLDRFKVINDSLGHGAGDELLLALVPRLGDILRPNDTVARLSGDEFVIVCEGARGVRQVITVAERIAAACSRPFVLESGEHFMTASIGVAVANSPDDSPESLLRDAGAAMYRAKKRGPGRYELFDDTMRGAVLARLRVETELRRALDHGELRVHYQPIVDTAYGRPTATEALVRWEHPQRGLVPPLEFIPMAEETGLIIELGRFVLEQACAQAAAWQKRFGVPLKVFVNASGRQLADSMFPAQVADIVRRSGLLPDTLGLEVTESVLMEEAESPMTVLNELVDQGLRLVLDDFGTGYSSLSYLKDFPLDGLKIDRGFIQGLGRSPSETAIVKAVIDMSQALGMTVVAEGVETEQQREQLSELGCTRLQGYLFSKPRPAEEIGEFLAEHLGFGAGAEVGTDLVVI